MANVFKIVAEMDNMSGELFHFETLANALGSQYDTYSYSSKLCPSGLTTNLDLDIGSLLIVFCPTSATLLIDGVDEIQVNGFFIADIDVGTSVSVQLDVFTSDVRVYALTLATS